MVWALNSHKDEFAAKHSKAVVLKFFLNYVCFVSYFCHNLDRSVLGQVSYMTKENQIDNCVGGLQDQIYLDYPATTPCDPRVFAKMEPYFYKLYGNPHSRNHVYGWTADEAVDIARMHIADYLRVDEREIIFTSGATEANVLALRGVTQQCKKQHSIFLNQIITCKTEHLSVLNCCRQLEREGFEVIYLDVKEDGLIDINDLLKAITKKTLLVSIMAVNNETGVIQPMEEIGDICFEKGILFHSDLTQAIGKMNIKIQAWNLALASFSSHKVYGPKGVGGLFVRRKPNVKLESFMQGGGQERGIRGGTLPVPLCVGFGEALKILSAEQDTELLRISELSKMFVDVALKKIPLSCLNGDSIHKVPHINNIAFPYVEGESIVMGLENVCVSTGSACSSANLEPSHVLKAMKKDEFIVQSSIRFGIGRYTTKKDIERTLEKLINVVQRMRSISPLWDMYRKGVDFSSIVWK